MYWENELMVEALQTLVSHGLRLFRDKVYFRDGAVTPEFLALISEPQGLSHGERVFVQVLRDLWNGQGHTELGEMYYIDYSVRDRIFALYQALSYSREAVIAWIDEYTG